MRYGWFFVCQPVIPKKDCLSIDDLLRVSFLHLSFYCKFALQLLVKPVFGFCLKRMSHSCGMYFKYYNSIWTNKESQKSRLFKHSIEPDLIISIFKDIQTCIHVGATFSGVKNLKEKKMRQSIFDIPIEVPSWKLLAFTVGIDSFPENVHHFFILCLFFLIVIVRHRRILIAHFSWFECVSLSLTLTHSVCVPYIYAKYCLYSQCILHVWLLLRVRFICRPFVVVVFFRWVVRVFLFVWE